MTVFSAPDHELRDEEHYFDVVVVGGGLAGLCAAISAARGGARTALLQERPVLGGNCSSEIRVVPHGSNFANAWAQETGLPHAIILADRRSNYQQFIQHGMINSCFDMTLMEFARQEPRLTVFYNTTARYVESERCGEGATAQATANGLGRLGGERRRITAVRATQLGSERELFFRAAQFIDATGDGTIGFLAGADYRYGREARAEFSEPLAPEKADDVALGSTITFSARDTGAPVPFVAPAWAMDYRSEEEIGFLRKIHPFSGPLYSGFWWMEVCNPFHQISDNQAVRDELHRHLLGVWGYIKNHSALKEQARNFALEWIGMLPGKRESRRLVGDVVLSEAHCHRDAKWPDAVAFAGWWIDLHISGGILNKCDPSEREETDGNYKHWIRVPIHTLPLRAFYSRNVENLWMAGRCLSTTHVALGPARVMQTLGMMGQAVGAAAAFALRNELLPRQLADPKGEWISVFQQQLLRDDVRIPGLRNMDSADLALRAVVTASSSAPLRLEPCSTSPCAMLGEAAGAYEALAAVLPVTGENIERVQCHVMNPEAVPQRITLKLERLERIWDREPGVSITSLQVALPAGHDGWVEFPIEAKVQPGFPYRFILEPEPGKALGWRYAAEQPTGTLAQYRHHCKGGPEPKNAVLPGFQKSEALIPPYLHWGQIPRRTLALALTPEPRPYTGAQVNNGVAWPEVMPNLWISDRSCPLPQYVELQWEEPLHFDRVEVSFDTNLGRLSQHAPAFFAAPECAKDWRLEVWREGEWRAVYRDSGNFQRKRIVSLLPQWSSGLRLVVEETHGALEARIYEIRVYHTESSESPSLTSVLSTTATKYRRECLGSVPDEVF